ncbi:hypothetical protein JSR06_00635 [Candidatus Vidania fulgoroideae]|uniref:Uncharacterized protein n=1 Tax=Candidatus Vidania fulgoroideorum TaxID=881286 RepID=A0A974X9Q5_9PROT|nr:hypothetical protein JSR06_00635 [Candidatus Vidania fulgoroideae]
MVNTKQKNLFLEEIRRYIYNKDGYYIDLTYGKGKISKLISDSIGRNGKLISYEINKQFKLLGELKKKKNIYYYNKCFTNIRRLKLEKRITCSVIDIGITENELINKCNKLSLISFPSGGNINEALNFTNIRVLDRKLSLFKENKNKLRVVKEIRNIRNKALITQFNRTINVKSKYIDSLTSYLSSNITIRKIKKTLRYIVDITEKMSYIIIICFNSKESSIVDEFYNKNKKELCYCKTITKKMIQKSLVSMKVIKKK